MEGYTPRIVDSELAAIVTHIPAVFIEGAKGVGKTMTAQRLAKTVLNLDEAPVRDLMRANPDAIAKFEPPVLLDEWQHVPEIWNKVRRLVDGGAPPGSFILTGSVSQTDLNLHSGAGRILNLRMRPLSLRERFRTTGGVSLSAMLAQGKPMSLSLEGRTAIGYEDYVREMVLSGFPGIRRAGGAYATRLVEGYIDYAVSHDFAVQGVSLRRPQALKRWLRAFAAATATDAGYTEILDAATAGEADKPGKNASLAYREALERLWLIDELPPWTEGRDYFARLKQTPRHHLADPALASALLGVSDEDLSRGRARSVFDKMAGGIAGRLFESLVAQSVRVYADACRASASYARTQNGDHEIDLIVRQGQRVLAFEVKLAPTVSDEDTRHLAWIRNRLGDALADAAVITSGPDCYRRTDGFGVIPAALLGA